MKVEVITKATGGWSFHFGITEEQAQAVLLASDGDVIELDGEDETLTIGESEIRHFAKIKNGSTNEWVVASDVREKLQTMISEDAWVTSADEN